MTSQCRGNECIDCRFAHDNPIRGDAMVECRRFPPVMFHQTGNNPGQFPLVKIGWTCGEWKPEDRRQGKYKP